VPSMEKMKGKQYPPKTELMENLSGSSARHTENGQSGQVQSRGGNKTSPNSYKRGKQG